jgi:hypothetical protein
MGRPKSTGFARGTRVVRHDDPDTVGVVVARGFRLLAGDVMVQWPGHTCPERARDLTHAPGVAAPPPKRPGKSRSRLDRRRGAG